MKLTMRKRENLVGWAFLTPAVVLIVIMNFVPIAQAMLMAFQSGRTGNMTFTGISNFTRIVRDSRCMDALKVTLEYVVVTVPLILALALILAVLLNDPKLKLKGIYRTCIFVPAAVSMVASAVIFRSLFAADGFVNSILVNVGILQTGYNFLGHPSSARIILMMVRVWKMLGYQMIFYLAALQGIDSTIYEAAKIDGATGLQQFFKITIPMLKPTMVFTVVMSVNAAIQVYDESVNLTNGGPGNATMPIAHYIYGLAFNGVPNFGYACALSMVVLVVVGVMAIIQMKVGDRRE
ncbi:MAG: sugar ABC transporter permease [Ruminococcus sp.]|nr:sugar ABC transporter permease [Ruminococcus sp.]